MSDKELFQKLVEDGALTESSADKTLREAETVGGAAEELLYKNKLVDETLVANAKSSLLRIPYKKVNPSEVKDELLQLIPYETSKNYRVIPIEKEGNMLVVGMLYPLDTKAQDALRFVAKREGLGLGVYLVTPSDLRAVWNKYLPYESDIQNAVKELNIKGGEGANVVSLEEGGKTAEDAPIIKIVASTLKKAVDIGASDVHIEPQRTRLRIRFRENGTLKEALSLPLGLSQPIISRVKVLARLRLDETRMPQDGRFRTIVAERDIDYRVSTFPTPNGEKVAIRVLDPKTGLKTLEDLGIGEYNRKPLEDALFSPFGMIIISGPTGSGKTTSLYAMMQKINTEGVNIVSLEDPVEYLMEGVNQSQIKPEIGYDFASGLRQILRQDPDVIMVGEIRDIETASLAVNAALTGHVVLSTIHTNNALGVIPRLIDLKVPEFLLPSALNLLLAQRLVSELCPDCHEKYEPNPEMKKIISDNLASFKAKRKEDDIPKEPYTLFRANQKPDCPTCKGKGIVGRIALFEILKITKELGEVIGHEFDEAKLEKAAMSQGMVTMREDGIIKALKGKVSIEEVMKETE